MEVVFNFVAKVPFQSCSCVFFGFDILTYLSLKKNSFHGNTLIVVTNLMSKQIIIINYMFSPHLAVVRFCEM